MEFDPDIIVTGEAWPRTRMVVETKLEKRHLPEVTSQLKRYMAAMSCPLGLLVLPDQVWIFRERYTGDDDGSIEQLGPYSLAGVFPPMAPGPDAGVKFEDLVQNWITDLIAAERPTGGPSELVKAIEEHVLPMVVGGDVAAAHPREYATR